MSSPRWWLVLAPLFSVMMSCGEGSPGENQNQGPACGDGIQNGTEACDGQDLGAQSCESLGHVAGGTLACTQACTLDTSGCIGPVCGNGTCDADETTTGCPADCGVQQISAAFGHTCARLGTGEVWCWGKNAAGQLGDGSTQDRTAPVQVQGLSWAIELGAGYDDTCAVVSGGDVYCWGDGAWGSLGNGSLQNQSTPSQVDGANDAMQVTQRGQGCIINVMGEVLCWGWNFAGQVGDGTEENRLAAVPVSGVDSVLAVTAGTLHTCALRDDGEVYCWGSNAYGQLGTEGYSHTCGYDTNPIGCTLAPVNVVDFHGAVAVSAGYEYNCAIKDDGTVWCWGQEDYGRLGNGGTAEGPTPTMVVGLTNVVDVSAGSYHACAVKEDGTAWCWGDDSAGQLGVGDGFYDRWSTPVQVSGLTEVVGIAAGGYHSCAFRRDRTVWCWGRGTAVGDGNPEGIRETPVAVLMPW